MKYILVLLFLANSVFAFGEKIDSFEANFVQTIIDEENKKLVYKGEIFATKPNSVLWHYQEPVNKKIYIKKFEAVIIEPELEQVIIKNLRSEIDFFSILSKAKKIDETHYKAFYKEIEFILEEDKDGHIKSLNYSDELENKVKIVFSNQKTNQKIKNSIFMPVVPKGFDVIEE